MWYWFMPKMEKKKEIENLWNNGSSIKNIKYEKVTPLHK